MAEKENDMTRRQFVRDGLRGGALLSLGGLCGFAWGRPQTTETVWQLDPYKCVQCGKCTTHCVLNPSAVKCVHSYEICGYCDICYGFLAPKYNQVAAGAENELCPTSAIVRKYVEGPHFEYIIKEELCIGCAKCVEGCTISGFGSLHLQVRHDRCVNCNECAIAVACPAQAFKRVPANRPYLIKGKKTAPHMDDDKRNGTQGQSA